MYWAIESMHMLAELCNYFTREDTSSWDNIFVDPSYDKIQGHNIMQAWTLYIIILHGYYRTLW